MTPRENRQRQVDAMYEEMERRDHEREKGLSPWMHVEGVVPVRPENKEPRPDHDAILRIALQNRYNERYDL